MNKAIYWALAREYSQAIFSRSESAFADARPPAQGEGTLGDLITKKTGNCAIISISGEICRETLVSSWTGKIYRLGHDAIYQAIESALANPFIKSIVLAIDSPGGIVAGTKELFDFIAEASKAKPMAAYADGLCASAAFWLASATGKIYAPATALVGSIGVIMRFENWAGWYTKAGVQIEYITSGKFKAAGADTKELSDEDRQYFESQLAELHSIFREDVRKSLALTTDDSLWAEAQLLPATQAEKLGLVTGIVRDLDAVVKLMNRENKMDLKELKAEHPELVEALAREFAEKAKAENAAVAANCREELMALIKSVAGEETAKKIEALVKAGITASQLESIRPLLAKSETPQETGEEESRKRILAGLENGGNAPLPESRVTQTRKNPLLADAERRQREAKC